MKAFTSISVTMLFALTFILTGCGKKDDDTQTKKDDKTTTQTLPKTQTTTTVPKIGKIWDSIQNKNDE